MVPDGYIYRFEKRDSNKIKLMYIDKEETKDYLDIFGYLCIYVKKFDQLWSINHEK